MKGLLALALLVGLLLAYPAVALVGLVSLVWFIIAIRAHVRRSRMEDAELDHQAHEAQWLQQERNKQAKLLAREAEERNARKTLNRQKRWAALTIAPR